MNKSITTVESESDSIVLKKLTKGYGWEIKCYGGSIDEILTKINNAEENLKKKYGTDE